MFWKKTPQPAPTSAAIPDRAASRSSETAAASGAPNAVRAPQPYGEPGTFPDNPVLVRAWRGGEIESQHRGAWVLTDASGAVIEGAGAFQAHTFARSSIKSLQALALVESGAAERFQVSDAELALACSSHNAEACHTEPVAAWLARIGLEARHLRCGPQPPGDPQARAALAARGEKPSALHNNCSGKHAGFLTLSKHLGADPAAYLEPDGAVQRAVRQAVLEMCGLSPVATDVAVDGCSAPTFRVPLAALAAALARVANPKAHAALAPARRSACERLLAAVEKHPQLIAGKHKRLCTDLARVSSGRLFPKIGAEAVYVIGVRGKGRGLAVKLDDGGERGLAPLVLALVEKFQLLSPSELGQLEGWREKTLYNRAGLMVGRTEVLV